MSEHLDLAGVYLITRTYATDSSRGNPFERVLDLARPGSPAPIREQTDRLLIDSATDRRA